MNLKNVLLLQYALTIYSKIKIKKVTILHVSQKLNAARLVQLNHSSQKLICCFIEHPTLEKILLKLINKITSQIIFPITFLYHLFRTF